MVVWSCDRFIVGMHASVMQIKSPMRKRAVASEKRGKQQYNQRVELSERNIERRVRNVFRCKILTSLSHTSCCSAAGCCLMFTSIRPDRAIQTLTSEFIFNELSDIKQAVR